MNLFVYGSLMSRPELERVLGRPYEGEYRPHKLHGYRRELGRLPMAKSRISVYGKTLHLPLAGF